MKKHYIIGILLSILFSYLVFRQIDVQSFVDGLKNARYIYILPVAFFGFTGFYMRAWRWKYFLYPLKNIPLGKVWSATVIGYMGINILPMRLGELARPYAIGLLSGVSKSSALATVVVERLLDTVVLMIFFALVLLGLDFPDWFIHGSYFVIAAILLLISFLVFLFFQENRVLAWAEILLRRFPAVLAGKIRHILESFIKGLLVFKSTEHYGIIFIQTLLMWLSYTLGCYYAFYAFDFVQTYHLNLFSALVVIVVTAVGLMIPSAPGSWGTYHWFCQEGMHFMGVPKEVALGYAILIHGISYVMISVLGVIYLWLENIRFADVHKSSMNE